MARKEKLELTWIGKERRAKGVDGSCLWHFLNPQFGRWA